ncbi:MAG: hypothetical protein AMS27_07380 [Bacteroides sp. SM23_62_1]|nr:MAG: hypothetical protein AMS27_07380 [Bacteroides sp. SM23_62_1]
MIVPSKKKEWILLACIAGSVLYISFNIFAMVLYPGGTLIDENRIGYSLSENFFSDLGMAMAYGGESKPGSRWLFMSALILIGILLILFFIVFADFFVASKIEKYISRAGSAAGIAAGLSCIGIALTPWDLYFKAHMIFSYTFSISFILLAILYAIVIQLSRTYYTRYAIVLLIYLVTLLVFLGLMIWGPSIDTPAGLRLLAVSQKIIIYSGMICLFIQFFGAYFYIKNIFKLSDMAKLGYSIRQ